MNNNTTQDKYNPTSSGVNNFEPVIGLEIHVQLKTKSKMFCSSPNNPDVEEPNVNICEICTGQPGSLPSANQEAINKALMVGLALNCEIPEYSKFDRKNYFYPDLPKGYQISQYDQPLAKKGRVELVIEGQMRSIGITRAHLEEDAGKLIHQQEYTLVDLNRAGTPLLEIVTEPDFRSATEAKQFLQNLRNIVRYLNVSDADMEKGHLRCDANISMREVATIDLPPYKVEIKNLNSFKAVEAALEYEVKRQSTALGNGEKLRNETRGWDEAKSITVGQRVKEEAQDYRYFPEPDLPIMHFTKKYIDAIARQLPELPNAKEKRFMTEFGLSEKEAEVLVADKNLAAYFEEVVSELQEWMKELPLASLRGRSGPTPSLPALSRVEGIKEGEKGGVQKFAKMASNWIVGDFQALLKETNIAPQESKITAENLAELIKMIDRGEVSVTAGKKVLVIMFEKGGDPSNIAQDEGLLQVSDEVVIAEIIDEIIAENAKVIEDYKAGKKQALGVLVGKVMAKMKGQANPQMVNRILEEKLK